MAETLPSQKRSAKRQLVHHRMIHSSEESGSICSSLQRRGLQTIVIPSVDRRERCRCLSLMVQDEIGQHPLDLPVLIATAMAGDSPQGLLAHSSSDCGSPEAQFEAGSISQSG